MNCKNCGLKFQFNQKDQTILDNISPVFNDKKIPIPKPTFCPDCRQQRRLTFRNERKLYQRKCNLCQTNIISIYSPDKPLTVYCSTCWWSDKWDALSYGRDYDFNKPFFQQIGEILAKVPLLSNTVWNSVNSEYNSYCTNSKDCYMSTRLGDSENILYSYLPIKSVGCVDCRNITDCQYCYECIDCQNCYNSHFCQQSKTCSDCTFCYDCIGCKNCFGCTGLRNCEYYFFNQKYSKEEYQQKIAEYNLGTHKGIQEAKEKFNRELTKKPHRAAYIINSQNAVGDYILESKDIDNCFDVEKTDTASFTWGVEYSKDINHSSFIYFGENCYENMSNSRSTNILFSAVTIEGVFDVIYCLNAVNGTNNCFGSVSLKKQKYCILNKQYSKEEYQALMPKILAHMKSTGQLGEFFPISLSPFAYNETVAQEYFPLTKALALAKGYKWKDQDNKEYQPQKSQIPEDIKSTDENILKEILACTNCGKNYKIVAQELKFHKQAGLAIPHKCPDCRHEARLALRNPRKLWARQCAKCQAQIQTSYSPERPETIYCEKCYLESVY